VVIMFFLYFQIAMYWFKFAAASYL
jgi:hypothetical protein